MNPVFKPRDPNNPFQQRTAVRPPSHRSARASSQVTHASQLLFDLSVALWTIALVQGFFVPHEVTSWLKPVALKPGWLWGHLERESGSVGLAWLQAKERGEETGSKMPAVDHPAACSSGGAQRDEAGVSAVLAPFHQDDGGCEGPQALERARRFQRPLTSRKWS